MILLITCFYGTDREKHTGVSALRNVGYINKIPEVCKRCRNMKEKEGKKATVSHQILVDLVHQSFTC